MTALALAAGVCRSTASRFFGVHGVSLAASLGILKALSIEFDDVATPATDEQLERWQASNPSSG